MKKLITFILLSISILSFGSFNVYADDVTYTFDEEKYQIIPKDLSGTEWSIKDIEDINFNYYNLNTFSVRLLYNINIIIVNEDNDSINSDVLEIEIRYEIFDDYGFIRLYDLDGLDILGISFDSSGLSYIEGGTYGSIDYIKFTDGDDIKNQGLISFMIQYFNWQNPPAPTEPVIPEEPTDEPFLTSNEISKLMIALVIYIVALFVGMLIKSKLLLAMSGLLWLIPLTTIDNFIIRIFSIIMLIISLMILLKERDDYYD
jgi:hypothetical protein